MPSEISPLSISLAIVNVDEASVIINKFFTVIYLYLPYCIKAMNGLVLNLERKAMCSVYPIR